MPHYFYHKLIVFGDLVFISLPSIAKAEGQSLVGCHWPVIQQIRSYPPYFVIFLQPDNA